MNAFRFLFFLFLGIFPFYLSSTIYLSEPDHFQPKIEVAACFLEYQDQILLLHRQDQKAQGNLWGIPGGKIERSETPFDAVIREVLEETSFDISSQPMVYLGKVYIKYPTFDYIYHMFKCTPAEHPGKVKISFNEHKGFTWVRPEDALKMNLMLDEDDCIKLIYFN